MIDYVKALETANWYLDLQRRGMKFDKPEAVKDLAKYDLFTAVEIGWVLEVSPGYARKYMGDSLSTSNRVWKTGALYILWLLAIDWRDDRTISVPLVQLASEHGTSIKSISQLTGIPLNDVREAVYGKPNLLDLLRSGVDAQSD